MTIASYVGLRKTREDIAEATEVRPHPEFGVRGRVGFWEKKGDDKIVPIGRPVTNSEYRNNNKDVPHQLFFSNADLDLNFTGLDQELPSRGK